MKPEEPKYVCHTCIGDEFLAKQVEKEGAQAECTYCGATNTAFTLADLSYRINQVVKDHFTPRPECDVSEQFEQGLYDNKILIEKVTGLEEDIAADVREYLFDELAWKVNVEGEEENGYSDGFLYAEREADTSDLRSAWWDFKEDIRSRTRFFGATTVATLDRIFGNLASHKTIWDKPVIREIKPGDINSSFWRARTAHSEPEMKSILESLSSRLGPPPSDKATAGRMNAEGIPVFYGALEEETCVSEVRAPVGSFVILARFDLLNPIRVLDLNELSSIYSDFKHFDPNYKEKRSRERFLEELVGEMNKPVMPHEEAREYIATQIVSEYLANRVEPRLHGIIFSSAQTGGVGHNVVLFNGSCSVEDYELPRGTAIGFRVWIPLQPGIPPPRTESSQGSIIQTEPQRPVEETEQITEEHTISDLKTQDRHEDSILRLEPQSLKVLAISRVKYESEPLPLNLNYHVSAEIIKSNVEISMPKVTVSRSNENQDQETGQEPVEVDPDIHTSS